MTGIACNMLNRRAALAICLLVTPWQALLADDADLTAAIRSENALLRESGHLSVMDANIAAAGLIAEVYERRGFAPAWEDPGRVSSLLIAIRSSYQEGLDPRDYHLERIVKLQGQRQVGREPSLTERAATELILTDALIRLTYHLTNGKVDAATRGLASTFDQPLNGAEPYRVVEEIIGSDSIAEAIASIVPRSGDYRRLKAELRRYRLLADAGGWPAVPEGPTIRPDSADPRLASLAKRVAASGDLPKEKASLPASEYDETLQDAVRRFQARHGLETDALVGRATLRELNVPIEERIDQIRLNLERARWVFDFRDDDYVEVNIPSFRANVVSDGQVVWTTKVIVGKSEDMTPTFRSALQNLVFNPTWTVPFSIASEEYLPRIKADPGFFARGNFDLLDHDANAIDPSRIDWASVNTSSFPFTMVQRPGPGNQLGQVKFVFPNEYSVFMHDTPGKYLFDRSRRDFSHGCIRVDQPLELAELLLDADGWTREQIESQVESGQTRTVALSEPLPMLLHYWTARVDDQGAMHFYPDIYERDAAVLEALDTSL